MRLSADCSDASYGQEAGARWTSGTHRVGPHAPLLHHHRRLPNPSSLQNLPGLSIRAQLHTRLCQFPTHRGIGGGSLRTYECRLIISLISPDEYWYSFLLLPKMTTATSTEHNTESSWAFLKRPPFRLRKVLQRFSMPQTKRKSRDRDIH